MTVSDASVRRPKLARPPLNPPLNFSFYWFWYQPMVWDY